MQTVDIETGDIRMDICQEIEPEDPIDNITNDFTRCGLNREPITIFIAGLLEKLVKEMKYIKEYDIESGQYILKMEPPGWFEGLDEKYKKILIKLIEPVLSYYIKN